MADSLLPKRQSTVPVDEASPGAIANTSEYYKPIAQVRLPKIELQKYSGEVEGWQSYYDTFLALVHNNNNITPIEKFHYLLSCLSGSALSLVKGIPVTADNYPIAFETLVQRFHNKRILAVNYLDKIINYSPLKTGSLNELQKLTGLLHESVNALKAVKIDNLAEFILFHLAARTLDSDTRKQFEIQNSLEIPTFEQLLSYLQGYVKVLEASESSAISKRIIQRPIDYRTTDQRNKNNFRYQQTSLPVNVGIDINSGPYLDAGDPYADLPGPHSDSGPDSGSAYNCEDSPVIVTSGSGNNNNVEIYASSSNKFPECVCCGFTHHAIYKCPVFHMMDINGRLGVIKAKTLCVNCLRPHHTVEKCLSKSSCFRCQGRHHTLVHKEGVSATHRIASTCQPETKETNNIVSVNSISFNSLSDNHRAFILLGTCMVHVASPNGVFKVRALIDSGAQDCFMTVDCARRLGLSLRRCNVTVAGLGQNTVHQIKGITSCVVRSRDSRGSQFEISPIVMDRITSKMPMVEISSVVRDSLQHLVLADEYFDKPKDIELLLGAELFHNIYDGKRIELGPGLPVALHSIFGWVVTGRIDLSCRPPPNTSAFFASTLALDKVIKQFWEIEEPPMKKVTDPEDEACEQMYTDLVSRDSAGRYVVPLLLKEPIQELGDSHDAALSRLYNMEKRLRKHEPLQMEYGQFMREYAALGHMRRVTPAEDKGLNFIPHHHVLQPNSSTTRLRVVFDGSFKTSNGRSINDLVYTGPKLQNDVVDIITKFRLPKIVFTADISKMYRNIDLRPEDRKYQHILWRETPDDPVQEFELNTLTYGVSSSPYLAIRTLHQLAKDYGKDCPIAADALLEDTFMDDITAGAVSVAKAVQLKDEIVKLLDYGKFELRKWSSNSPEFLADLPVEHCQVTKSFGDDNSQLGLKILGIQWDPSQDIFTYSVSEVGSNCTKRSILSNIARIYDPLGWVTPVVLVAKLLMQHLWELQLGWDEVVSDEVSQRWRDFVQDLKHIHELRIPRRVTSSEMERYTLVGFCDGSTKGYGCCVYLISTGNHGTTSHLLIAKSRVAPLKTLTVNRLELCGAALLARVLSHTCQLLKKRLDISGVIAFTDSSTVLAWLRTPPHKLKTFVSHRVTKIIEQVKLEHWMHVSTHHNPADMCSRGSSCSHLISSSLWWSGPDWLSNEVRSWPIQTVSPNDQHIPEMKSATRDSYTAGVAVERDPISHLLENSSSFFQVQRVIAWCLRFIRNSKLPHENCKASVLTSEELKASVLLLVKHEQCLYFKDEINLIQSEQPCTKNIQKLNPFLDNNGIIRVGGRLRNAHLPQNAIHPFLLPKTSRLSILIIDYFHRSHLHCGPRTLQSIIVRNFWILGVRNSIRSRLAKCVTCFKVKPVPCQPSMGNLPPLRVQGTTRCFENIAIDFAGPFMLKESHRRKAPTYKTYICVMVCLAVKAIHLEPVTELSTSAFIAALDRFVSRRGLCRTIISDCGTNFVGAKRYLNEMHQLLLTRQADLQGEIANRNIEWHLNPPTGSHFGGIFESGVKSMKYHLKRVVGLQILTYEELSTILAKVEAVLNSRPLCASSSDPSEVDVLTPGHFLVGGPLVALPEPGLEDTFIPPRERWLLLQKVTQDFWRIWQRDYLHTLQQRLKWYQNRGSVQIHDIVMIVDDNLPPLAWRVGRVVQTHPGSDGIVRVVTLRTNKGTLRRPVTKLCPLPLNN